MTSTDSSGFTELVLLYPEVPKIEQKPRKRYTVRVLNDPWRLSVTRKKIEITPGRTRRLNARVKRLAGHNPAQAAAELAALMRTYGLKKWSGRSLGALDMQANTAVYLSDLSIDGSHWQGPSDNPNARMSRFSAGQRVISLYTPSGEQALVLRDHLTSATLPQSRRHAQLRTRPFSVEYGTRLEIHTHRLPFTPQPNMQVWQGCCRKHAELSREAIYSGAVVVVSTWISRGPGGSAARRAVRSSRLVAAAAQTP
jgi:hypothetical protein